MSAQTTPDDYASDDEEQSPIIRVLLTIRGSFLYSVFTLGVILLVLGVLNEFLAFVRPLMSAMFFMWGVSAMLYAVLGIVALRLVGYN